MTKRMLVMLVAVAVFVAVLGGLKYRQVKAGMAEGESFQPPPEAVTTIVAERSDWPNTIRGIGTMNAVQGVMVSADLPGIVAKISFESGRPVRAGDLLVALDARQEQAQLAAARAQLELSRQQYERISGLRKKGVTSQAELDQVEAQLAQAEARVGEIEATIDRKKIRAPFSGVLGIRQVNLGQYLPGGAPVVELQALDPIYADFTVPQQDIGRLPIGSPVEVEADKGQIQAEGRVSAVDAVVDPATRNLKVRAEFDNKDGRLRPGMFVEVRVGLGSAEALVTVPATAISYAPYGDSVFIVEDAPDAEGGEKKQVRQKFVQLAGTRGDQVALSSGVEPGQEVVTSGVFKLRNGAAVLVNNEVQPSNDPAPRPENS